MTSSQPSHHLTPRELEIVHLLAKGWSNREIAEEYSLTIRTIKYHTGHIYAKLGVRSRAAAIAWVWEQGAILK